MTSDLKAEMIEAERKRDETLKHIGVIAKKLQRRLPGVPAHEYYELLRLLTEWRELLDTYDEWCAEVACVKREIERDNT